MGVGKPGREQRTDEGRQVSRCCVDTGQEEMGIKQWMFILTSCLRGNDSEVWVVIHLCQPDFPDLTQSFFSSWLLCGYEGKWKFLRLWKIPCLGLEVTFSLFPVCQDLVRVIGVISYHMASQVNPFHELRSIIKNQHWFDSLARFVQSG